MVIVDVLVAVILVGHAMHVLVDLLGCSVVVGPVGLGSEAEGVVVGWDIAFAPGVPIP